MSKHATPETADIVDVVDAKEAKATNNEIAEAAAQDTQVVPAAPAGALGTYSVGAAPIAFEWIHMTYAVSKNAPSSALPGEYYLGKNWEAKLTERYGSFDAIILKAISGYKDWPTGVYDPTFKAQYYPDRAAAIRAGRRVDWADGPNGTRLKPDAAPYLQLFMLVKKTPSVEDDSLFTVPLDGELYAPATMMFEKMNYADANTVINRALQADMMRHMKENGYRPTLMDRVFRIGSDEQTAKTGNKFTRFTIKNAIDNGKPVVLSDTAKDDLRRLVEMASATTAEATTFGEDE